MLSSFLSFCVRMRNVSLRVCAAQLRTGGAIEPSGGRGQRQNTDATTTSAARTHTHTHTHAYKHEVCVRMPKTTTPPTKVCTCVCVCVFAYACVDTMRVHTSAHTCMSSARCQVRDTSAHTCFDTLNTNIHARVHVHVVMRYAVRLFRCNLQTTLRSQIIPNEQGQLSELKREHASTSELKQAS